MAKDMVEADGNGESEAATRRGLQYLQEPTEDGLWKPGDYILRRRFCPITDVAATLDRHRRFTGASEVAVISMDDRFFLSTLSMVRHGQTAGGYEAERILRQSRIRQRTGSSRNPLWTTLRDHDLLHGLEAAGTPRLYVDGGDGFFKLLLEMHKVSPWRIVGNFDPDETLAVNCLVLQRGVRPDPASDLDRRILERVNGTAHASVHRDRKVTVKIEKALELMTQSPDESHGAQLAPLMRLALDVTKSSAAAVYLYDGSSRSGDKLVLWCHETTTTDRQPTRTIALRQHDSETLASMSFRIRRPLLKDDDEGEPGPSSTWPLSRREKQFEIAVPIPSAPGGSGTPNSGVFALLRCEADSQSYGNYDLALLRNVALRISLVLTAEKTNDAGLMVRDVAERFAVAEGQAKMGVGGLEPGRVESEDQSVGVDLPTWLQADIRQTMPALTKLLPFAGRLTGAHCVTLRQLTLGGNRGVPYSEPTLVRLAAWPQWRLEEEYPALMLKESSVNSWVARKGQTCYIANINKPENLATFPGLGSVKRVPHRQTRAELCVPVIVDRRLIGTMNFESRHPSAFSGQVHVAEACAAQAALLIASNRRRSLRDVTSIGSEVQNSVHELAKIRDNLVIERRASLKSGNGKVLDSLDSVIQGLKVGVSPELIPDGLDALVRRAALEAKLRTEHFRQLKISVQWSQTMRRKIFLALFEIFRNARTHGTLTEAGMLRLSAETREVGGKEYVQLLMSHGVSVNQVPNISELYHVPIRRPGDRLHIGAFIAGAILRSFGGDVTASLIDATRLLSVVSIPVNGPTESASAAS